MKPFHPLPPLPPSVSPHPLLSRLAHSTICIRFLSTLLIEGLCVLKSLGQTSALSCRRSSQSINLWRSEEEREGKWERREGGREVGGEVPTVSLALPHQCIPLNPPNNPTRHRSTGFSFQMSETQRQDVTFPRDMLQ